jgi:hypothetical protein
MARIDNGNALATAMLQPGAKFQSDGYGLVTGTLVYREDTTGSSAFLARGQPCPIAGFTFCKVHKANTGVDALGLSTYTVDYVGIGSGGISSVLTKPQVGISQGLTSEHISTHTNFFTATTGIAGPAPFTASTIVTTEFKGLNGAHFEKALGGKFLGFKDPASPLYYGKTNYLAPQTSFSGFFYTSTEATPPALVGLVGKTSGTGSFNSIYMLPTYMGTAYVTASGSPARNQLLLAQVNVEDFGLLFKVNYEIRYNRDGYVAAVYPTA